MTYPPQPGQQPVGQYPGSPYPGFPSYPGGQYPQGQNPYGQQGGYGPPPPKKRRTGLWVTLSVTAAAVVAFAVTAFVAPGFLLGDDGESPNSADAGVGSAQALAEQLRDALDRQDSAALRELACPDATGMVTGTIAEVSEVSDAEIHGQVQENGDTALARTSVTFYDIPITFDNTLVNRDGSWCWHDLAIEGGNLPGSDTTGTPGEAGSANAAQDGDAFLNEFVSTVNSGDTATAVSMVCPGVNSTKEGVQKAASSGVTFTADGPATSEEDSDGSVSIELSLTGDDGSTLSIAADNADGAFCVYHALYY